MFEQDVLSSLEKGLPSGADVPLGEVGNQSWNVLAEDMTLPVAVLLEPNLLDNARWMERFARDQGVWLYPHGKTTMAPQIFDLQLRHGCRGITAANALHAEVCLRFGVQSVFMANQVVDRQSLLRLARSCKSYPEADFFLIIDSADNLRSVVEHLKTPIQSQQIKLLIEVGVTGGRTGIRSVEEAVELAKLMAAEGCRARGISAFEGIFQMRDMDTATAQVESLLEDMANIYRELVNLDLFGDGTVYLSAGGSAFYDLVAIRFQALSQVRENQIIVRSGCYISHDNGMYIRAYNDMLDRGLIQPDDHLKPALEVWAKVQSQPEPGLAFANAGKRDLSYDIQMPVVNWWYRPGLHQQPIAAKGEVVVIALNDQHAYLTFTDDTPLQVGDLVGLGISHPCTTFDKWKYLFLTDDNYNVTGAVKTFF